MGRALYYYDEEDEDDEPDPPDVELDEETLEDDEVEEDDELELSEVDGVELLDPESPVFVFVSELPSPFVSLAPSFFPSAALWSPPALGSFSLLE